MTVVVMWKEPFHMQTYNNVVSIEKLTSSYVITIDTTVYNFNVDDVKLFIV